MRATGCCSQSFVQDKGQGKKGENNGAAAGKMMYDWVQQVRTGKTEKNNPLVYSANDRFGTEQRCGSNSTF